MRRVIIAILLILAVALTVGFLMIARERMGGIRVTVTNDGPHPLSDVVAHVTGRPYPIGNLAVGESRTIRVLAKTDSHLELKFWDHVGRPQELNAGGYFDNYSYGTIEVEIKDGEIVRNVHQIEPNWF